MKAIVIGSGPSLKKYNHLETLAKSNFKGIIICADTALKASLEAGVTPDKFNDFFCLSTEDDWRCTILYRFDVILKYGPKINFVFITVHEALQEYMKDNKFNVIILEDTKDTQILASVGLICWHYAWNNLGCDEIALIGMNQSYSLNYLNNFNDSKDIFFKREYNPSLKCHYVLDPLFQYYFKTFREYLEKSPIWVKTINCAQEGSIYHKRVECMDFDDWLKK